SRRNYYSRRQHRWRHPYDDHSDRSRDQQGQLASGVGARDHPDRHHDRRKRRRFHSRQLESSSMTGLTRRAVQTLLLISTLLSTTTTTHAQTAYITVASTTSTEQSGLFGHILPV